MVTSSGGGAPVRFGARASAVAVLMAEQPPPLTPSASGAASGLASSGAVTPPPSGLGALLAGGTGGELPPAPLSGLRVPHPSGASRSSPPPTPIDASASDLGLARPPRRETLSTLRAPGGALRASPSDALIAASGPFAAYVLPNGTVRVLTRGGAGRALLKGLDGPPAALDAVAVPVRAPDVEGRPPSRAAAAPWLVLVVLAASASGKARAWAVGPASADPASASLTGDLPVAACDLEPRGFSQAAAKLRDAQGAGAAAPRPSVHVAVAAVPSGRRGAPADAAANGAAQDAASKSSPSRGLISGLLSTLTGGSATPSAPSTPSAPERDAISVAVSLSFQDAVASGLLELTGAGALRRALEEDAAEDGGEDAEDDGASRVARAAEGVALSPGGLLVERIGGPASALAYEASADAGASGSGSGSGSRAPPPLAAVSPPDEVRLWTGGSAAPRVLHLSPKLIGDAGSGLAAFLVESAERPAARRGPGAPERPPLSLVLVTGTTLAACPLTADAAGLSALSDALVLSVGWVEDGAAPAGAAPAAAFLPSLGVLALAHPSRPELLLATLRASAASASPRYAFARVAKAELSHRAVAVALREAEPGAAPGARLAFEAVVRHPSEIASYTFDGAQLGLGAEEDGEAEADGEGAASAGETTGKALADADGVESVRRQLDAVLGAEAEDEEREEEEEEGEPTAAGEEQEREDRRAGAAAPAAAPTPAPASVSADENGASSSAPSVEGAASETSARPSSKASEASAASTAAPSAASLPLPLASGALSGTRVASPPPSGPPPPTSAAAGAKPPAGFTLLSRAKSPLPEETAKAGSKAAEAGAQASASSRNVVVVSRQAVAAKGAVPSAAPATAPASILQDAARPTSLLDADVATEVLTDAVAREGAATRAALAALESRLSDVEDGCGRAAGAAARAELRGALEVRPLGSMGHGHGAGLTAGVGAGLASGPLARAVADAAAKAAKDASAGAAQAAAQAAAAAAATAAAQAAAVAASRAATQAAQAAAERPPVAPEVDPVALRAAVAQSLPSALEAPLRAAVRDAFASSLIPALEAATRQCFAQVETVLASAVAAAAAELSGPQAALAQATRALGERLAAADALVARLESAAAAADARGAVAAAAAAARPPRAADGIGGSEGSEGAVVRAGPPHAPPPGYGREDPRLVQGRAPYPGYGPPPPPQGPFQGPPPPYAGGPSASPPPPYAPSPDRAGGYGPPPQDRVAGPAYGRGPLPPPGYGPPPPGYGLPPPPGYGQAPLPAPSAPRGPPPSAPPSGEASMAGETPLAARQNPSFASEHPQGEVEASSGAYGAPPGFGSPRFPPSHLQPQGRWAAAEDVVTSEPPRTAPEADAAAAASPPPEREAGGEATTSPAAPGDESEESGRAETSRLLAEGRLDEAFTTTLSCNSGPLLLWLLREPTAQAALADPQRPRVEPLAVLILIQQISAGLASVRSPQDLATLSTWLRDASAALDPQDEVVREHAGPVLAKAREVAARVAGWAPEREAGELRVAVMLLQGRSAEVAR